MYLSKLTESGQAYAEAERARSQAMKDLKKEIKKAYEKGATVTQIAKASGVTRQTIYTVLKED